MTITLEMVERELHKLPKETRNAGQFGGCVYTNGDGQHCIAGQVLANLDVIVPGPSDNYNSATDVKTLVAETHIAIDDDATALLLRAQGHADGTYGSVLPTWGEVVDVIRPERITLEHVKRELGRLPRGNVNPICEVTVPGGISMCANNGPDGTHCIAAQVLLNLGHKIPDRLNLADIRVVADDLKFKIDDDALELLRVAQFRADTAARNTKGLDKTWGPVVDNLLASTLTPIPTTVGAAPKLNPHALIETRKALYPPYVFNVTPLPRLAGKVADLLVVDDPTPKPATADCSGTLTTAQVCKETGVSEPTLRRWRDQGIVDNIHYPATVQWSKQEAKIVKVLSWLPNLSPEAYSRVAKQLRVTGTDWFDLFLVLRSGNVHVVKRSGLALTLAGAVGAMTVLDLHQV